MTTKQTKQPFEKCASNGKREQLANRFTAYLDTRDTDRHAFVTNLNGGWGTGKTYFVEEWQKLLQEQGYIAIKIDAWESDYLNDPLSILVAEILEQVKEQDPRDDFTEIEKSIARHLIGLTKAVAPTVIKGILANWVWGEETNKELIDVVEKGIDSIKGINSPKLDAKLGEFGLEVMGQHKRHKQFSKDFKIELENLLNIVNNSKNEPKEKTYIFVDELDRCRPTYAIEMLETVKHLFDIPNVIFVLSTDTEQLEHSIKAVYGQDFNSREYLSRFFNQRMVLPEPDLLEFIKAEKAFESLDLSDLKSFPQINVTEQLQDAFCIFCELNNQNLSFRKIKYLIAIAEGLLVEPEVLNYQFSIYLFLAAIFGDTLYSSKKIDSDKATEYTYFPPSSPSKFAQERLPPVAKGQSFSKFITDTNRYFHTYTTNFCIDEPVSMWPIFKEHSRHPLVCKIFIDEKGCNNEFESIKQNLNRGIKSISTPHEMIDLIRRTSASFEEG